MFFMDIPDASTGIVEGIYRQYHLLMLKVAYNSLIDKQLTEDVVQMAFEKIIKNYDKIDEISCPKTKQYIVIITRNTAYSMNVKNRRHADFEFFDDETSVPDSERYLPEQIVESKDSEQRIEDIMMALPDIYRDALMLSVYYEYTYADIARDMNITEAAAKKRVLRARKMMEKKMKREELL